MISDHLFFSQYQKNYFNLKQSWLKYQLDNFKKEDFASGHLEDITENEIITALKTDIRQTYFQSIETVFELFFLLLEDKNEKSKRNFIERLSTQGTTSYSKISEIATNSNYFEILDREILTESKEKVLLGQNLFYFGSNSKSKYYTEIKESLSAIKYALRIIALDFNNRAEYNSFKHGLRIMPALKNLSILNLSDGKKELVFPLEDSMSFFSYDKKNKKSFYITKVMDTDRDIRMTSICSNLIFLMLKYRDVLYNRNSKNLEFPILIFGIDDVRAAAETSVKIQDIVYTFKES